MTGPQPVSFARALRLMAGLAARRQMNRWQSLRWRGRKADPAKRTGTGTKSTGRSVYSFFILAILGFNGFNLASQGVARLAAMAGNAQLSASTIVVSSYTRQALVQADTAFKRVRQMSDAAEREKYEGLWDRYLDKVLQNEVNRESLSDDDEAGRVRYLRDAFDRKGPAAFTAAFGRGLYSDGATWPRTGAAAVTFQNALGVVMLLFVPMLVCLWLGMNNKDLGQVEWSLEWLYAFPISARALLASRLFVYSVLNPPVWFFICPLLIIVCYAGGAGWNAITLGVAATLYLSALAGSITMLLEVILRKFVALGQLKNLQALFTVVGTVSLMLYIASLLSQPLERFLVEKAGALPATFTWNPLACPLLLAAPSSTPAAGWMAGFSMVAFALVLAAFALVAAEFLVRDGLLKSGGPYQGVRRRSSSAPASGARWLRGIAANEMILLRRDRNLMVQILVSPLLVVAYYFLINSSLVSSATGNFHHAATMAFIIGAYVLMSSAMPVLSRENKTLWQLLTYPRALDSILLEKTIVWAVFALLYAGTTLLILVHFSRHLHAGAWADAALALYGVALYAFIAAGIGIMGTNTLETEVRARFRTDMVYLYMVLVAMYAVTIYLPSIWGKFAQLTLTTLLAFALWQKVRDVTPYLLDPLEKPVRALSLADGMIAALAFFVLQGVFGFFLAQSKDVPLEMQVTLAYVMAGFLVFVLCLVTFVSQKIPHLWQSVGLEPADKQPFPLVKSVLLGFAYGGGAAIGAMLYLHVLDLVPAWQIWKEDAEMMSLFNRGGNPLWLCLLAVVAAPLFEEFIFRGLVFQGLRRSTGPFWATLASAALFALVHPPFAVIPVFGLGIATAMSFQRSGLLLAPIIAHATYNTYILFFSH